MIDYNSGQSGKPIGKALFQYWGLRSALSGSTAPYIGSNGGATPTHPYGN